MSISQGVVSYSPGFPVFVVEEPAPRQLNGPIGSGPAFAAALAQDKRTQAAKPAGEGPDSATPETAEPDPLEAQPQDEAEPPTAPEAAEASEEILPDQDVVAEDVVPQPLVVVAQPAPVLPVTAKGQAAAVNLPDAAVTLGPALIADAADTGLADEPMVVVAAQLPFVTAGDGTGKAAGPGDSDLATVAGLGPVTLSPAAQASRAIAGFGQGLTAVRAPGQPAVTDAQPTAPEAEVDQTALRVALAAPTPTPAPVTPPVAVLTWVAAAEALAGGDTDSGQMPLDGGDGVPLSAGGQIPASTGLPALASTPVVAAPTQLAPVIAAAVARGDGPAEITVTLSPDELGTLQMRVAMDGDSLRVTLLAERPETLDLLRRHGDQLLNDLRSLGFGGASLGFGTSGGGTGAQRSDDGQVATDAPPPALALSQTSPAPSRITRVGGLDLRL